jgi:hypothetical protein
MSAAVILDISLQEGVQDQLFLGSEMAFYASDVQYPPSIIIISPLLIVIISKH